MQSVLHKKLPQGMMTLCHQYLQPMGMMHNIFSSTVFDLFSDATRFSMQVTTRPNASAPALTVESQVCDCGCMTDDERHFSLVNRKVWVNAQHPLTTAGE